MREWNLKSGDPLALTLAADARLGATNYYDDQIWELQLGGGDPPALALHTTYGLRARSQRLFPRFVQGDQELSNPTEYAVPPVVHQFYPNYIRLHFSPFQALDVEAEYWVPSSQALAGRLKIRNSGQSAQGLRFSWVAQLTPNEGQRMAPAELQAAPLLAGRSDNLSPVVFMTGGPQAVSSPFPALNLDLELEPGQERILTWCHAALAECENSFNLARQTVARLWEAEIARVAMVNSGQVEIYTGNPDWDSALALAHKQAQGLLVGPTDQLPALSFVLSRRPDQGYSMRGDGSDYNHQWNGQPGLDAFYLAGYLLPGYPQVVQGLVRNFLAARTENGDLDWKPGLAGQRSRLMATPILASLAWRAYQVSADQAFLEEVFPQLLEFIHAWFTERHDRDRDGVPEWDHPMQTGFEDHPVFSRWQNWAQGVEISTAESPALCSLLYRECRVLIDMAVNLKRQEALPALLSLADHLRTALEMAWRPEQSSYLYWDRDTHQTTGGELLGERLGSGVIVLQRSFEGAIRPLVRVHSGGETIPRPRVIISGESASGQHRVEHIGDDRFKWYLGRGVLTGERVYSQIEQVEIQGLRDGDSVQVYTVDYTRSDHTVLLPLWAGIPDPEQAEMMVRENITNPKIYWHPFGLPPCPHPPQGGENGVCGATHMPWNTLVGEGMLAYGFQAQAAELVTRLMQAVITGLKEDQAFFRAYDADSGKGIGERNALSGLAPLGLFLEALGVRPISPFQVYVSGFNPFPWPVTVKYRGLTVLRRKDKTLITFPNGQSLTVKGPAPQTVTLRLEEKA